MSPSSSLVELILDDLIELLTAQREGNVNDAVLRVVTDMDDMGDRLTQQLAMATLLATLASLASITADEWCEQIHAGDWPATVAAIRTRVQALLP